MAGSTFRTWFRALMGGAGGRDEVDTVVDTELLTPIANIATNAADIATLQSADDASIHDDTAGEIAAVTEKVTPVAADLLLIEDSEAANVKKKLQVGNLPGGTDAAAIHDDTAGEISAVTEKVTPVSADLILIEDSEAANAKKKLQIGNLPGGTDSAAIHDDTAGEIAAVAEKVTPVSGDLVLIEDSAAGNAKKRVQVGNLPSTDAAAIHDDTAGEIAAVTEKVSPVAGDLILIEDSAAGNAKKRVQVGNLPGGTDAAAIHDDTAAEISAVAEKTAPVSADLLLIEDSESANAKKRLQIGNLPSATVNLDASLDGAVPVWDGTQLTGGFSDEFPGSSLHADWTEFGVTGGNTVTVASDKVELHNASGVGALYIERAIQPHDCLEIICHITSNDLVAGAGGLIRLMSVDETLWMDFGLFRSGVNAREIWSRTSTASNFDGASWDASWHKIYIHELGYTHGYSTAAHTAEPDDDDWTIQRSEVAYKKLFRPAKIQLYCDNFQPSGTATLDFRHLKLIYK